MLNADFTYNVAAWKPEIKYNVIGGQGKLVVRQPGVGVQLDLTPATNGICVFKMRPPWI
ncbi:MAG: toast rack family protein [Candidatus Aegiribacteria sp.]|nr:toast rack family protein [Candidatus Aegiribacteria sp.]